MNLSSLQDTTAPTILLVLGPPLPPSTHPAISICDTLRDPLENFLTPPLPDTCRLYLAPGDGLEAVKNGAVGGSSPMVAVSCWTGCRTAAGARLHQAVPPLPGWPLTPATWSSRAKLLPWLCQSAAMQEAAPCRQWTGSIVSQQRPCGGVGDRREG